jgi:hypothetical protein
MTTGPQRADAQPADGTGEVEQTDWSVVPMGGDYAATQEWAAEEPETPPWRVRLIAGLLILLSLAWLGASLWVALRSEAMLSIEAAVRWVPVVSVPLILLAVGWVLFGRTPRRETERFTRAVAAMRAESGALENLLAVVAARLEENHARLTNEAAKLMSLGDEASDRLGRVAHYLAKESANLDRKSEALENAAQAARVDIGVLLHDLPRAEEQARAVAEAMREAGIGAYEQAGSLEGQLSALIARGREADEIVGGAAQRLAAHLARIESTATSATTRMDEAAGSMTAGVDAAMSRAADAVDAARSGLEAQGSAMLAMIEQSRSALERAGEDAGRNLAQRLEHIGEKIEGLAAHLAAQDAASHALVTGLSKDLAELDQRFAALSHTGETGTGALAVSVEAVRQALRELSEELSGEQDRAGEFMARASEMAEALNGVTQQLNEELPTALGRVEALAGQTHGAATRIAPEIEAIRAAADAAAAKVADAEASLARQQSALDTLIATLSSGLNQAEEQLRGLGAATEQADEAARRMTTGTGPELIEALIRVRETANQAAERAREAISAVIPESAAALGEASKTAVVDAINSTVSEQMSVLTDLAQRAVNTARKASERLTRQMLTIGQTTAAIEARINETRKESEDRDSEVLSRRVALLIESLNSTAIDVTKILSNEVTDTSWAAYLKGDRGIFTRRAVRLLNSGEARAIAQHYEEEPEFRDQVNRYIHDFEAMLRRILADREGTPLGVALLSSDMGKLYVALAQAIERLR